MSAIPLNFDCSTRCPADCASKSATRSLAYNPTLAAPTVLTKSLRFMEFLTAGLKDRPLQGPAPGSLWWPVFRPADHRYTAGEMDVMVKSSIFIAGTSAVPGL